MGLYHEDIIDVELNSGTIARAYLNHAIGEGDEMANRFGVALLRDGEPVNVESRTVTGVFIAPDGNRYVLSETSYPGSTGKSGNKAWVQLPSVCYNVEGNFSLVIKVSGGGVNGTMRIVDGTVAYTGESGAVVPTSTIPTTADLIAAYEDAVAMVDSSVRFDVEQDLSSAEAEQARENIGAASQSDLEEEANARDDADTALGGRIDDEADARAQEFSDLKGILFENVFDESSITQNYVINYQTGELQAANGFACTGFIPVKPYDIIAVPMSFGSNMQVCSLYDSNKHFISKNIYIGDGQTQYSGCLRAVINEQDAAFARFNIVPSSWIPYSKQFIAIIKSGAEALNISTKRVADVTDFFEYGNLTPDRLIKDDGTIGEFTNYAISDYIPVSMGDKVTVAFADKDLFPIGAFYDKNKNLLSVKIATNTAGSSESFYIPDRKVAYLRVNIANKLQFPYSNQYITVDKNGELIENCFYLDGANKVFYVGAGRSEPNSFSTLKACCDYILDHDIKNSIVHVDPETFNLVNEFGETYLDGISNNYPTGLFIGNNTHFVFREGARVVFKYTGTNPKVADYFSCFNIYGDFILENADIEVTNARYCVHEDIRTIGPLGYSIPETFSGKYINCRMKHNANTIGEYEALSCIGASAHPNGITIIDGGYFNSLSSYIYDILYHNYDITYSGDHPSELIIKNVYAEQGFILAGNSSSKVDVFISGCHTANETEIIDPNNHFNVRSW